MEALERAAEQVARQIRGMAPPFTADELTVLIEACREYRLRVGLDRRAVIDPLVLKLITQLAEEGE